MKSFIIKEIIWLAMFAWFLYCGISEIGNQNTPIDIKVAFFAISAFCLCAALVVAWFYHKDSR